ncbi:hypothetical protein D3C77_317810 [compost metagenome]
MRIELAAYDGHSRVATAAVRTQPLVTSTLVAMGFDQRCDVVTAVELGNDLWQSITRTFSG